jgi:hypothetical protein
MGLRVIDAHGGVDEILGIQARGEDAQAGKERMHDVKTPPGKMRRSSAFYRVVAVVT